MHLAVEGCGYWLWAKRFRIYTGEPDATTEQMVIGAVNALRDYQTGSLDLDENGGYLKRVVKSRRLFERRVDGLDWEHHAVTTRHVAKLNGH